MAVHQQHTKVRQLHPCQVGTAWQLYKGSPVKLNKSNIHHINSDVFLRLATTPTTTPAPPLQHPHSLGSPPKEQPAKRAAPHTHNHPLDHLPPALDTPLAAEILSLNNSFTYPPAGSLQLPSAQPVRGSQRSSAPPLNNGQLAALFTTGTWPQPGHPRTAVQHCPS